MDTLIVKFSAPCNLACTYCYEYSSGDETWRSKPKFLSVDNAARIGLLAKEHAASHGISEFKIVAHGGEPLLMGPQRLDEIFEVLRQSSSPCPIKFSLQTNATLMNPDFCEVFRKHRVVVGVSLDGGNEDHNKLRVTHAGKSSWSRIVEGLKLLKANAPECFGGLLCVINTELEPCEVIDGLMKFDPPMIDLLQPFTSLDTAGANRERIAHEFGKWMNVALRHWLENYGKRRTKIRYFEDALKSSITGKPSTDWFGARRVGYLVIETDGKIDLLDQLKAVGPSSLECRNLNSTIWDSSFEDAVIQANKLIHNLSGDTLPEDCSGCRWEDVCGAGHLPSRYSVNKGFNNRSTYCEGIQMVLDYCKDIISNANANQAQPILQKKSALGV